MLNATQSKLLKFIPFKGLYFIGRGYGLALSDQKNRLDSVNNRASLQW